MLEFENAVMGFIALNFRRDGGSEGSKLSKVPHQRASGIVGRQKSVWGGANYLASPTKGALKMREWKMQEWKMREQIAGVENAGVENAGAIMRRNPSEEIP